MKIRKLLCAAAALCITLVAGMTVQAASEKESLKAYSDMLSKPTIKWSNTCPNEPTSRLKFALVDFNNDGTPELYVEADPHSGVDVHFKIFSCNGSKQPVCIITSPTDESLISYAPGRKMICVKRSDRAGIIKTYYKISSGKAEEKLSYIDPYGGAANEYYLGKYYYSKKITKSEYDKKKKSLLKNNAENNKIYVKTNTAANRKKYLTVNSTPKLLKLSKKNITKYVGTTCQLKVSMSGLTGPLRWTSSNINVATVNSSGKVSAKKAGNTTVTVSVGNLSASCNVTVKPENTAASYRQKYKNYLAKMDSSYSFAIVDSAEGYPVLLITDKTAGGYAKNCSVYYVGKKVSQVGKLKVSSLIQYKNGSIYQAQRRSWIKIDVQKGKLVTKRYTDFSEYEKAAPENIKFLKNTSANRNNI